MISSGGPPSMTTAVNYSAFLKLEYFARSRDIKHQSFVAVPGSSHFLIPISDFSSFCIPMSGFRRTNEVVQLLPTATSDIVVREARVEDLWEVAETHCNAFFPDYSFPLDFLLRIDRLVGMLFGFSIPKGCKRTCLVAVAATSHVDVFSLEESGLRTGRFSQDFSLDRGYIVGILTVDTVGDYLPKRSLRQRRAGIAYISNVAVREEYRRNGIAKKLVLKAVAKATSWECRAIALHCDLNNEGATKLYTSQGFKCIRVPDGANWPQPSTCADTHLTFMMKLL